MTVAVHSDHRPGSEQCILRVIDNSRGIAAMEFALVAPILLLIVFATIEFSWYLTNWTVLTHAVAQGARTGVKARDWGSNNRAAEDPIQFAEAALVASLWTVEDLPNENIDIKIIDADGTAPRRLRVEVTDLPYRPITGYLGKTMLPAVLAAKAIVAFP